MRSSGGRIPAILETLRASVAPPAPLRPAPSHPPAAARLLGAPEVPGRFALAERLGVGGMGLVFRAYDRVLGQDVALKVLRSGAVQDRVLLKREFRTLASLIHPNMVHLHELFADHHACFFTMELVRGTDFVKHFEPLRAAGARRSPGELESLRKAALQLALALSHLHEHGKLHCDVKPHNVLVTPAGRVVLLDFGLLASLDGKPSVERSDALMGTLQYMAPEQLWSTPLTAAADWYAFGVTLYEAVAGQLPVPARGLFAKHFARPVSLLERGCHVPESLDALVRRLLEPRPEDRPSTEQILAELGAGALEVHAVAPASEHPERDLLVGREAPLGVLEGALSALFSAPAGDQARVVHVSGSSGVGKTALVRRFFERARQAGALALSSRCHPQEALAFNALDGLVDQLAHELFAESGLTLSTSVRRQALARLFPVLGPALPPALRHDGAPLPRGVDLRSEAIAALHELLCQLGERRPLLVWIDDVQWGDRDSGVVLARLLSASPPLRALVVLSYRGEDRGTSPCLSALAEGAETPPSALSIRLEPLPLQASVRLVRELLGADDVSRSPAVQRLIEAAQGVPFFLCELGRYLAARPPDAEPLAGPGLDHIWRARLRGLPSSAMTLLEVFAVAGAPLEQAVALRAAGIEREGWVLCNQLERLSVLRTTDAGRRRAELYHHKIRDDLLLRLPRETVAAHHLAIADALLATSVPNPMVAVEHFELAGDLRAVRRYVLAAANHASRVLAFDRAADLYQRALELSAGELPAHELYRRLAVSYANAGRGREAGDAYRQAAVALAAERPHEQEQIVALRQRSAEQLIQTGYYREGMDAQRAVLAELGVAFPESGAAALRRAAALRLRLLLVRPRTPSATRATPSQSALRRFDALMATSTRLAMVDYALSSYAIARCAIDALRLGEPARMICALSLEGASSATLPGPIFARRAERLLEAAADCLARYPGDYERSFYVAMRGVLCFYQGHYGKTVAFADEAAVILRGMATGTRWENTPWQMWSMLGLAMLGDMPELVRRVSDGWLDAERRADRLAAQNVSLGKPTLAWLALDLPEEAISRADRALSWAASPYTAQHYQHYVTTTEAELYRGNPLSAWQRTLDTWASHEKNAFLLLTFMRDDLLQTRGKSALAVAARMGSDSERVGGYSRRRLRRVAAQAAERLAAHGLPCAVGWSWLLRACIAYQEGRLDAAAAALSRAAEVFEAGEMALYREATRYARGLVLGGDAGRALVTQAAAWMEGRQIADPHAMTRMIVPGIVT